MRFPPANTKLGVKYIEKESKFFHKKEVFLYRCIIYEEKLLLLPKDMEL